jgi:NAD(P)-dependent dehydrogenase (short-subunit alcohol dehydrogenase family)
VCTCRAKDSIRVNCVSPWYIATDLALQVPGEKKKRNEPSPCYCCRTICCNIKAGIEMELSCSIVRMNHIVQGLKNIPFRNINMII